MERAKAFIVDACLAEGDKFFHDIDDVGGAHDAFYGFSVYHSFSDFKKSRGRARGGKNSNMRSRWGIVFGVPCLRPCAG